MLLVQTAKDAVLDHNPAWSGLSKVGKEKETFLKNITRVVKQRLEGDTIS